MRAQTVSHLLACVLVWGLLAGCATERRYATARPLFDLQGQTGKVQFDDAAIAAAFGSRSQLRLPATVAVYEHTAPCDRYDIRENEDVETAVEALKGRHGLAQVFVLSERFVPGKVTVRSARVAAARHHADLTLLMDTDFRTHVAHTPLVLLSIAVVPAYVLPSTTIEVETRVTAHLVDTRNGRIYYSAQKTKRWERFMPIARTRRAVLSNRRRMIDESCTEIAQEIDDHLMSAAMSAWRGGSTVRLEVLAPSAGVPAPTPSGVRYETVTQP